MKNLKPTFCPLETIVLKIAYFLSITPQTSIVFKLYQPEFLTVYKLIKEEVKVMLVYN
jgi:hypothetical protein